MILKNFIRFSLTFMVVKTLMDYLVFDERKIEILETLFMSAFVGLFLALTYPIWSRKKA